MERQPSVMNHNFSQVPKAEIQRSSFNRDHGLKTTFNAGELIPIFIDEALPGDTFNCKMQGFGRLATPLFPFMDNMFCETFFFAVPNRLVWDNWQRFNGEQPNPGDTTDFTIPTVNTPVGGHLHDSLYDYMGVPPLVDIAPVNNLHGRAYNLIYNEWFRDENLQDSIPVDTDDTSDDPANYVIRKRGKRHDYFTSCLPWPQKGDAVDLPLGTRAPVNITVDPSDAPTSLYMTNSSTYGDVRGGVFGSAGSSVGLEFTADLTEATASTINQLREAFQVQRLYERDARGGTRYTEIIRSHFGVISPDSRLQRPEYLGGGSSMINVNPIAQTSSTDTTTPQGNLAAMGTLNLNNHGFTKSFTEHCVIIGLVCVRADLTYQQGLNRLWTRQTRWDYYWPALAHLGEQAVLNKEIYAQGTSSDDQTFGYQERYAEYRYKPSQITSRMRSNYPQSLDSWHLSQDFETLPVLNSTFIEENPPVKRVIAVPTEPDFLFDAYFQLKTARPMPMYGVPGLIDHF